MTEPCAAARVFAVSELLENILLEADAKDALVAQRVSREWRDAVQGSVALLRKIFLLPSTTGTDKALYGNDIPIEWDEDAVYRLNPRCSSAPFHPFIKIRDPNRDPSSKTFAEALEIYGFPIGRSGCNQVDVGLPEDFCSACCSVMEQKEHFAKPSFSPRKLHQSWRKMCLFQPAIEDICLGLVCEGNLIMMGYLDAATPLVELVDWLEDEYVKHVEDKRKEHADEKRAAEQEKRQQTSI